MKYFPYDYDVGNRFSGNSLFSLHQLKEQKVLINAK